MALIALGVCGGIGAYKAIEVARGLQKRGHDVAAIMTRSARRFVGEVTFEAITRRRVDHRPVRPRRQRRHRAHLARDRHRPAARRAGDGEHHRQVRQRHCRRLPDVAVSGDARTGAHGAGHEYQHARARGGAAQHGDAGGPRRAIRRSGRRLPRLRLDRQGAARGARGRSSKPPNALLQPAGSLLGRLVVVTAGPTYEDIDDVRYIGNRSSGKMGYAIAAEAARRGARVMLVSGPATLPPPAGVELVRVRSADADACRRPAARRRGRHRDHGRGGGGLHAASARRRKDRKDRRPARR